MTVAVEIMAVLIIVFSKDLFKQTEMVKVFHILCDAFFVTGFVTFGIGLLIFSTNEGVFDGIGYAVGSFVNMFKKDPAKKYGSLYDYRESRGRKNVEFGFVVICGLAFLVISMIMYLLYRKYL